MSLAEPTPCAKCRGTGHRLELEFYTNPTFKCPACDGLGWWLPEHYKEFFNELWEKSPKLFKSILKYYTKKM